MLLDCLEKLNPRARRACIHNDTPKRAGAKKQVSKRIHASVGFCDRAARLSLLGRVEPEQGVWGDLQKVCQRKELHVAYEPGSPLNFIYLDAADLVPPAAHPFGYLGLVNTKFLSQLSDSLADNVLLFRFSGFKALFQSEW